MRFFELEAWQIAAFFFLLKQNPEFASAFAEKYNFDSEITLYDSKKGFFIEFVDEKEINYSSEMNINNAIIELTIDGSVYPVGIIIFIDKKIITQIEFHSSFGELDWSAIKNFNIIKRD